MLQGYSDSSSSSATKAAQYSRGCPQWYSHDAYRDPQLCQQKVLTECRLIIKTNISSSATSAERIVTILLGSWYQWYWSPQWYLHAYHCENITGLVSWCPHPFILELVLGWWDNGQWRLQSVGLSRPQIYALELFPFKKQASCSKRNIGNKDWQNLVQIA